MTQIIPVPELYELHMNRMSDIAMALHALAKDKLDAQEFSEGYTLGAMARDLTDATESFEHLAARSLENRSK